MPVGCLCCRLYLRSDAAVPCICDSIPGGLRAYVSEERRHPVGKSSRHLHIFLRNTSLYRIEWGVDAKGAKFVNVQTGKAGNRKLARKIERWVRFKFDELSAAHDLVISGADFKMVDWVE